MQVSPQEPSDICCSSVPLVDTPCPIDIAIGIPDVSAAVEGLPGVTAVHTDHEQLG